MSRSEMAVQLGTTTRQFKRLMRNHPDEFDAVEHIEQYWHPDAVEVARKLLRMDAFPNGYALAERMGLEELWRKQE